PAGEGKGETEKGQALLRNVESGTVLASGQPNPGASNFPPIRVIAAADDDRVVVLRSSAQNNLETFQAGSAPTRSTVKVPVSFTAAALFGDRLLLGYEDGTIRLVQLAPAGSILYETKKLGTGILRVGFSRGGRWAYAMSGTVASGDRGPGGRGAAAVLVWNAETWGDFFSITITAGAPTCAAFAFDDT